MMSILILFLISLFTYHSFALNHDGLLLLSFKFSIVSDPSHVLDTWTVSADTPCQWHGVSCSGTGGLDLGRVTEVSLPGSQLLGPIPVDFGLLDRLQILNLSSNLINGSVPDTLFNLSSLRVLDVSGNLISGEIPDLIGGLRSLEVLNVSGNSFQGNIPRNLGSLPNLSVVSLSGNSFTGNVPGGFNRVRVIDMSSNSLNGLLPIDFGGVHVRFLNLSNNRLTGDIPPEFGRKIPGNAIVDFSYNNISGEIPAGNIFQNQDKGSFAGNVNLCGPPLIGPCTIPSSPTALNNQPIPPPAFAVIPKSFASSPNGGPQEPNQGQNGKKHGLKPQTIVWIVVIDTGGIAILCVILLYIYKRKTKHGTTTTTNITTNNNTKNQLSSSSFSSSETKAIPRWSCLQKCNNKEEDTETETDDNESKSSVDGARPEEKGQLISVDGESELELETLLKASAYILGASGSSIMYKAVLQNGSVLAVRRVGESGNVDKMKEFEANVRGIAKMVHPNLVRLRGFFWSVDEKLVIYDFVPGGSLANARYRVTGSSPCHISWMVRLKIAKGIARGLSYIHEKKHVHGNLKPSNILLELDMEPKIGDLGIDKLTMGKSGYVPGGSTRHFGSKRSTNSRDSFPDYSIGATPSPSTSSIGCVSPYHPPESLRSLKPNSKWDVYSFGVLLLELLTGKVIVSDELGPPVLAGLAGGLDDKTRVLRMADPAIRVDLEGKEEDLFNCLKLGYNCVSHVPQKRPTIKEAVQVLEKISCSSTTASYHYGP